MAISPERRGTFAAYYTPAEIARVLTDWAVRRPDAPVLDPSFGGCAFLEAAVATLAARGAPRPCRLVYGVDIDPDTRASLRTLLATGASHSQYRIGDFFAVRHTDYPRGFQAVVGNPPYIRAHSLAPNAAERMHQRLRESGACVSRRASSWAGFVVYASTFLEPGARLALILPGAVLQTAYAASVREWLAQHFKAVTYVVVQQRLFEHTDEASVVLFADGFSPEPSRYPALVSVLAVDRASDLRPPRTDGTHAFGRSNDGVVNACDVGVLRRLVDHRVITALDGLANTGLSRALMDFASVGIGVVTGANAFFVLSDGERSARRLPAAYFLPTVRRPQQLAGLVFTAADFASLCEVDEPCLLLSTREPRVLLPEAVCAYLERGRRKGIHLRAQCGKRRPWYAVPVVEPPEAFATCMAAHGPRIVVNQAGVLATNNILCLSTIGNRDVSWRAIAVGILTSAASLAAEIIGRNYGGGVLKLEPSDLRRLPIPVLPDEAVEEVAPAIENALRAADHSLASDLADRAAVAAGIAASDLAVFRRAAETLRARRRAGRRNAGGP